MANTREYLLFTDCTMANPNGDMINDNRPRCDEETGKLEMSDVRLKRYFREEGDSRGLKIFSSPWNQRNSFWISVSSATEYPSFWQMDSICLFGIPVFGFFSSKYRIFDNNWVIEQNFEQLA